MQFTKTCIICGEKRRIIVNPKDFESWFRGDKAIQDAFPYLSEDEREMILCNMCSKCWKKLEEE